MKTDTTLKPCPFCGGEAFLRQIGNEHTKKRGWDVGCEKCRVKISYRVLHQSIEWLRPVTMANWNKRHV